MSNTNVYLVTGANGFIASFLVKRLVEEGAHVKATVRRQTSGDRVKQSISPDAKGKLEILLTPDITVKGAFKTALKDVTHVFHTASPVPGPGMTDTKKHFLDPARAGTLSLLQDARETPTVQKVVYTSSSAAILDLSRIHTGNTHTEKDWNPITYEHSLEIGEKLKSSNPAEVQQACFGVYTASKRVAEEAAWDFIEQSKSSFAFVAVHPVVVIGKPTLPCVGIEGSNAFLWNTLTTRPTQDLAGPSAFVDLADTVEGHIQAMNKDEANGGRFLLTAGSPLHHEIIRWAKDRQASLPFDKVEEPEDAEDVRSKMTKFDNTQSTKVLGIKYRSVKESVEAFADWVVESGVAKP
ncbi:hypothetical protein EX895_001865 [Sporisorium graminicola]|uniref:3-beta hydroxysteroid dehydrogenase/isomerase domain-containing protein n=1 Tax=Sporisorium graminicola TaxID=280036 RepID=A0A4U7KX26_9BASI|nr:hypothetical protein EX895_001865 [Sporisorium graminicola]TKY89334.1 hypothetical protein EX895_001865 [Sporisorium graminicola]